MVDDDVRIVDVWCQWQNRRKRIRLELLDINRTQTLESLLKLLALSLRSAKSIGMHALI